MRLLLLGGQPAGLCQCRCCRRWNEPRRQLDAARADGHLSSRQSRSRTHVLLRRPFQTVGKGSQIRGRRQDPALRSTMTAAATPSKPDFLTARPRAPDLHLFSTEHGAHAFIVDGSQLFDIDEQMFAELNAAIEGPDLGRKLAELGLTSRTRRIDDRAPERMPVRALSLAVAQKCNLGCTYCYAREGDFGGPAKNMPPETARAAVDLLLAETEPD